MRKDRFLTIKQLEELEESISDGDYDTTEYDKHVSALLGHISELNRDITTLELFLQDEISRLSSASEHELLTDYDNGTLYACKRIREFIYGQYLFKENLYGRRK